MTTDCKLEFDVLFLLRLFSTDEHTRFITSLTISLGIQGFTFGEWQSTRSPV